MKNVPTISSCSVIKNHGKGACLRQELAFEVTLRAVQGSDSLGGINQQRNVAEKVETLNDIIERWLAVECRV